MYRDRPYRQDPYDQDPYDDVRDGAYGYDERYLGASAPRRSGTDQGNVPMMLAVGAGVVAGAVGVAYLMREPGRRARRHPADDAPFRTTRLRSDGARTITGRTVTIGKPRSEVYAFWRDFSNLPSFMESIVSVTSTGADTHRWELRGPRDATIELETRVVEDVENERVRWTTVEGASVEARGEVAFRDAPAGRGTEVASTVDWRPPGGEAGRWIAKLFGSDPSIRTRRELKRLKMLLETGEVATSANRPG